VGKEDPAPAPGPPSQPQAAGGATKPKPKFAFLTRWFTRLKPRAHDLPEVVAVGFVDPGKVYINGASTPTPYGQKVLLQRPEAKGRLELTTTTPTDVPEAYKQKPRTYLSAIDRKAFGAGDQAPTVRRYRWYDSVGKLFSLAGLLVAVPAIAGAIGAWATLFGVLSPTPTELNVNSMQAALAWAAEPLAIMPAHPDPATENAAATEFEHRSLRANVCVQSLQGHRGPVPQIPKINCQPRSSSWVQNHGGQVAAGMTLLVTLAGLVTAARRTRFQQSP
jgi:hypothetical protein